MGKLGLSDEASTLFEVFLDLLVSSFDVLACVVGDFCGEIARRIKRAGDVFT